MPRENRDSKGYYKALNLELDASEEQIQLAYEMLCEQQPDQLGATRAEIERAYSVLINSASRNAYDRMATIPAKKKRKLVNLNDPRLLAACGAMLMAILLLVWLPLYGSRLRSFSAGDELVDLEGRPFGIIVKTDDRHPFPGGESATAYLIDMAGTRELRWFPAADLKTACRRSR